MVGAGQLARMTHQAAITLGQSLRVLAADPDDGAALVTADVVVGDYRDLEVLRAFARGCFPAAPIIRSFTRTDSRRPKPAMSSKRIPAIWST